MSRELRLFTFLAAFLITALAEKQAKLSSPEVTTPRKSTQKTIHVAIVAGCNSHFSLTVPISHALTKTATVKDKYRVTYVTSANCKKRVENVGGVLHDTGNWYYPITDPDVGIMEFATNFTMGECDKTIVSSTTLVS